MKETNLRQSMSRATRLGLNILRGNVFLVITMRRRQIGWILRAAMYFVYETCNDFPRQNAWIRRAAT
jgi:hypothetical protein